MNAQEAISLALPVIQDDPIATKLNLAGAIATFIDGAKATAQLQAKWPERAPDHPLQDYWQIDFPMWKEDKFQRTNITVIVDDATGRARILEDL